MEIISIPSAKVYLDGKEVGMTPYKKTDLTPGELEIKLIAENGREYGKKIRLENGSTTVVNRNLTDEGGGYSLLFEKTGYKNEAGLLVYSKPDRSAVAIDGEMKQYTPTRLDDVGVGDKQVTVSYPGKKTTDLFVKAIAGYQLVIDIELGNEKDIVLLNPTPTAISPKENTLKIKIKNTETGWLRVRSNDSTSGEEIARLNSGTTVLATDIKPEWIQVVLDNGESGWISAKYAEKVE